MKHGMYPPHPVLADYIKCLWTTEHEFRTPNDALQVLPDSYVELIFSFGARWYGEDDQAARNLRCYLVGLLDRPVRLRGEGVVKSVAARFYTWGFYPLLGREIQGAANAVRRLPAEWERLADQIEPAVLRDDAEAAVELLHDYLIECALATQFEPGALQAAARFLAQEQGQVKISALADYCHLSRRQLERHFKTALGESPKALARRMRFEKVRDSLTHEPHADLAALANEYGYADQAHLNREFKRFAQRTPAQFASEMLAVCEFLRSPGVAFVQYI
jgi:AraC-like DNA-binding protein